MAQLIKKLWRDPVWSKVIAGVILAVGAAIGAYSLNWWPAIGKFAAHSYELLLFSTSVPNWAILIMGLLSLPTLLFLGAFAWQVAFPHKPPSLSWRDYNTDIYFNLRWRWKYFSDGQVYDMHAFCPHCDFQIYAQDIGSYRIIDHISFHCESCGRHLAEFQESLSSLENRTKRFIQQKIRNGKHPH